VALRSARHLQLSFRDDPLLLPGLCHAEIEQRSVHERHEQCSGDQTRSPLWSYGFVALVHRKSLAHRLGKGLSVVLSISLDPPQTSTGSHRLGCRGSSRIVRSAV
jgi:hypothetical protein